MLFLAGLLGTGEGDRDLVAVVMMVVVMTVMITMMTVLYEIIKNSKCWMSV